MESERLLALIHFVVSVGEKQSHAPYLTRDRKFAMKNAIREIIEDVLIRKNAKLENEIQTETRHEHTNANFQSFCNADLLPVLNETVQALVEYRIPAEIKINPLIGFTQVDGIALVIGTAEYHGRNLLNSTSRVFILFELDLDEITLKIHVGGNDVISTNYPPLLCTISETSLPEIEQLIKNLVREAATVYFKV